jgi:hypothetical protein
VVSSAQNLIVNWLRFTAVLPALTTSNVWFAWFAPQPVNSSNFRLTGLDPQAVPTVGVIVGVKVRVTVEVRMLVLVGLLVEEAAGVLVGV